MREGTRQDSVLTFWAKVNTDGPMGALGRCWPWTASVRRDGYGQFRFEGRNSAAHRVAHQLAIGPIPEGLDLDHLCHNADLTCFGGNTCPHRLCCNPDHLEPATRQENARRGNKGAKHQDTRTHCANGHPFDEVNTYYEPPNGRRKCRLCRAAAVRRHWERHH
jgi:hypothetical protein